MRMSCSRLFPHVFLLLCVQHGDSINVEATDPAKRDPVTKNVGCAEWCKESVKSGWGDKKPDKQLPSDMGMPCERRFFRSSREEYTQFLSDRKRGLKTDQQIREILLKKSSSNTFVCAEGLYCATVSIPNIENILASQRYQFDTGARGF